MTRAVLQPVSKRYLSGMESVPMEQDSRIEMGASEPQAISCEAVAAVMLVIEGRFSMML